MIASSRKESDDDLVFDTGAVVDVVVVAVVLGLGGWWRP